MSLPIIRDLRVYQVIDDAGVVYDPPELGSRFIAMLRNIPLTEYPGREVSFFLYDPAQPSAPPLPEFVVLFNGRPVVFGDPATGPVPYVIAPPGQ